MRSLTRPEIPVAIEGDGVGVQTTEVGDLTASFIRLAKGTDLGPALVGLLMRTPSGDEVYEAGQAFHWAPGRVPLALDTAAYVDFSPTDEFTAVIRHIRGED
jgi:hypothetical protein